MASFHNIRNFLRESGSTIMSVSFKKKDGTIRTIMFNPKDRKEIKGVGTNVANPYIFRVRDLGIAKKYGSGAWRSFDSRDIISIKSRGVEYKFREV